MRALHVVASINRAVGGPAVSVSRLAAELAAQHVDTTVATLDYPEHGPQSGIGAAYLASVPATALTRVLRGWSPRFERELAGLAAAGADVIHNHGLWMFPNLYARRCAVRAGIPLLVSPRGMLDAWSLERSAARKMIAWSLFEKSNLHAAAAFHATSEVEAAAIRHRGLRQPIAVIPNGMDLPDPASIPDRALLESRFPELRGKQILLFLSRLHPKKGVAELVRAWRAIEPRHAQWQLLIAGPDLDGYGIEIRKQAADLERAGRVTFAGMLVDDAKSCALGHADILVLPTHSENFGLVVAEALAHGVPVVTTRAAPWSVLQRDNCGWWIEAGENHLCTALEAAMRAGRESRKAMGARGRDVIARDYSWKRIAGEMLAVYLWLRQRGERPACVVAD